MSRRVLVLSAGLFAALAGVPCAAADADAGVDPPMRVQARANPAQVRLGEPFIVELAITHLPDQRYELAPTQAELGDFEFLGVERQRVDGPDSSTTTLQVKLAGFALGKHRTPTLTVQIDQAGRSHDMELVGTEVDVLSALPQDAEQKGADLADVRPPEAVWVRTWRLLWVLGVLALAALAAWGTARYLNRPKPAPVVAQVPLEPLHLRTTRALDELAKLNLPAQGRMKEFHFRLSEIIRGYLGELYRFDALECTTPELLQQLHARHTPGLPLEELAVLTEESDFVRYAKQETTELDCKKALELGYRVVHHTYAALPGSSTPPPAGASA